MGNRPGSVLVIVILIVVTVVFGLLSIESTDNPTPKAIAPAEVATADDLRRRVYATIEGGVQFDYVETYEDADGDGTQDADETGDAWYYWLVDESGRGVTVRSTRNPDDIYRYTATGVLVRDPGYMSEGVARFSGLRALPTSNWRTSTTSKCATCRRASRSRSISSRIYPQPGRW